MNWETIDLNGRAFDLALTLRRGQSFRWEPTGIGHEYYEGVIFGNLVRVRQEQKHSDIEFTSEPCHPADFKSRFEDYLGLSHDLESVYADLSRRGATLPPLFEASRGMRVLRQEPWECLVSFICTRQVSVDTTAKSVEKVAKEFGSPIATDHGDHFAFPSALDVSVDGGEDKLGQLRLGRFHLQHAENVARAAKLVAEGRLDWVAVREMPYAFALGGLLELLSGVKDKIGNCVLLYSLDKLEAFPVDTRTWCAIRRHYCPDLRERVRHDLVPEVRRWAQNYFGQYAGYAQLYLFYDDLQNCRYH